MPRVIGIDPGTVTIDLCGLDDRRVFLARSIPTSEALESPLPILDALTSAAPLDMIAGPSGYGLPFTWADELTEADLRLAYLSAEGEPGGIRGLRALMRALAASSLPVVLTPGVIHLPSVPDHRKINRVDMGTADKVCAAALAVAQGMDLGRSPADVSLILLELGGAFTAAVAVQNGEIVDGVGGSSGPMGAYAPGALDGEVAFLAGTIGKDIVFRGGASAVAGVELESIDELAAVPTEEARVAWTAYVESAVKAVASLAVSVPGVSDIVLSGRNARAAGLADALQRQLASVLPRASVRLLVGFAEETSHAAQGAALIADGLARGTMAPLVERLGIREASGTVLDHLYVIDRAAARARLGIPD
jgi:predicted butyrate kinase (DUF1464 family)